MSFGKLLFIFICELDYLEPGMKKVPLALIQSLSIPKTRSTKDKDLNLYRLRTPRSKPYRIIPVRSIIRGVYLAEDQDNMEDFFAAHVGDGDLLLRLRTIFKPDTW